MILERSVPQIRFALSRGFAMCGGIRETFTQGGALKDSRFALGYYRPPLQGIQFAASPTIGYEERIL